MNPSTSHVSITLPVIQRRLTAAIPLSALFASVVLTPSFLPLGHLLEIARFVRGLPPLMMTTMVLLFVFLPLVLGAAVFIGGAQLLSLAQQTLVLTPDTFEVHSSLGPFRWQRKFPRSSVRNVRVRNALSFRTPPRETGASREAIVFRTPQGRQSVGAGLPLAELRRAERALVEAAPELAEAASTDEAIVSRRLERMSRNDNQLQIAFTPEGLPLWPALRMVVVFPALLGGFAWKLGQEIAFASPNRGLPPWALLPPVFGGWILLVAVEILPKLMKHTLMIGPDRLDLTATLGSVSRTRRLDRSKARAVGIRDASDGRAAIFCWIAKQPITLIAGLLESEAEAILREILRSQPDLDEGQA